MLKRLLILIALAIMATPAMAQTSFYSDRALQQVNVLTSPTPLTAAIPYGPVRVCSLPLTQQSPCLPLATVTDINGNAISNAIGPLFGQLTTDATGRFTFGCTNNVIYQVQIAASASNTPAVNYPVTCPGGIGASLGANNAFTGNNTHSGTETFNGAIALNSTLTQINVGSFVNGANTASSQLFVGGFTQAMANSIQGSSFLTDTNEVGLLVPSTSTIFQANGFNTFSLNKASATNMVGYYAQVGAKANNTHDWGMNPVLADFDDTGTSFTGSFLTGVEMDVNTKALSTNVIGVQMIENGPVAPGNTIAYSLNAANGGAWAVGFAVQNGAVPSGNAIQIGSEGGTGVANKPSANISLFGYNSGGVASGLNYQSSQDGDLIINTATNRGVGINLGGTIPTAPNEPASALDVSGTVRGTVFSSRSANPSSAGLLRMANTDKLSWRNAANSNNETIGDIQTARVGGCATGAVQFNTCDTTVTWGSAFVDANYTVTCTGEAVTSGVPIVEGVAISTAKVAASVTVRTLAITAVAAQFTTIDCTAVHD